MRLSRQQTSTERFHLISCLLFSIILLPSAVFSAELPSDSYCQLTLKSMEQQALEYKDLIPLAKQYKDDAQTFTLREKVKRVQFDQTRSTLYSSFGTDAEEYARYMGKNGQAVKAYLAKNPDVKQKIDALAAEVRSLMEQYESLKKSITSSAKNPS